MVELDETWWAQELHEQRVFARSQNCLDDSQFVNPFIKVNVFTRKTCGKKKANRACRDMGGKTDPVHKYYNWPEYNVPVPSIVAYNCLSLCQYYETVEQEVDMRTNRIVSEKVLED
jgi:hypothetical protein